MGAWNFKALESDNGLDVIDFTTIIKNNHKKGEYSNEKF